jgi:hypothetical protein
LADAAPEILSNQVNELHDRIEAIAPSAKRYPGGTMVLGQAERTVSEIREIIYRLLRGEQGDRLRQIVIQEGTTLHIVKAVKWLRITSKPSPG